VQAKSHGEGLGPTTWQADADYDAKGGFTSRHSWQRRRRAVIYFDVGKTGKAVSGRESE